MHMFIWMEWLSFCCEFCVALCSLWAMGAEHRVNYSSTNGQKHKFISVLSHSYGTSHCTHTHTHTYDDDVLGK